MAAAQLGLGDRTTALTLAEEAMAVCRRRGTRFWEFSALLTRSGALRASQGVDATKEIEAVLAEADAWLEMSGGLQALPLRRARRARSTDGRRSCAGARAP
jgi:hypothetical protein